MLPFGPPLEPMLSKAREEIPRGEGWRYEPKWDGFRAIVFRNGGDLGEDEVHIGSRGRRPLHRFFPELVGPLRDSLPAGSVVDGEIILSRDGRLEFESLQLRLHPAESRIRLLAAEIPASFVGFDLLALDGTDLRGEPLATRWAHLTDILEEASFDEILGPAPRVDRTPQTTDPDLAQAWMTELEPLGLDGVIAKQDDLAYRPGERAMVKVKRRKTADCVVGGYRMAKNGEGVGSLLLGLYDEHGALRHVGFTSSFRAKQRRDLLEVLRPHEGGDAFGQGMGPGGPSRWRREESEWVPLEPVLVVEVAYDHTTGHRFRHGTTFLRWREDKVPETCTMDQLRTG